MIVVDLDEREAQLVGALVDHHVAEVMSGFVEGTVTWTGQLNVDPRLSAEVVGVVLAWVEAARMVRHKINAAARAAGINLDDKVSSSDKQRGTDG